MRKQEIERGFAIIDGTTASRNGLEALAAQVDAFTTVHGEMPETAQWRERLTALLAQVDELETIAASGDCESVAELATFTRFAFLDTDIGYTSRVKRRLVIGSTSSEISISNQVNTPLQLISVSQQITDENGQVISTTSLGDPQSVPAGETSAMSLDAKFDNAHPAAQGCVLPLARRTYACAFLVVTSVEVQGRQACPQTSLTHMERIRFESRHLPDNYTIKLRRD